MSKLIIRVKDAKFISKYKSHLVSVIISADNDEQYNFFEEILQGKRVMQDSEGIYFENINFQTVCMTAKFISLYYDLDCYITVDDFENEIIKENLLNNAKYWFDIDNLEETGGTDYA